MRFIIFLWIVLFPACALAGQAEAIVRIRATIVNPKQFGMSWDIFKDRNVYGSKGWQTLYCCRLAAYQGDRGDKDYCHDPDIEGWIGAGVCDIMG